MNISLGLAITRGFHAHRIDPLLQAAMSVVATGVNGALYDPSTFSSLWEDSTRTISASINGPVGAMDDLSGHGYHRVQATTAKKPFLRGTPQGPELLTGGDFASADGWTQGAGWTIGSGVATGAASSGVLERADLVPVPGRVYAIKWTAARTGGLVVMTFGGAAGAIRTGTGHNGAWTDYVVAVNTDPLRFTGTAWSGTIDNVSVKSADAADVAAPFFLRGDGTDDYLQTAGPMDWSSVNKAFVAAAGRFERPSAQYLEIMAPTITPGQPGYADGVWGFGNTGPTVRNMAFAVYSEVDGVVKAASRAGPQELFAFHRILSVQFDRAGATTQDKVIPYFNGALVTPTIDSADPDFSDNFGSNPCACLGYIDGFAGFMAGNYYGAALVPRATPLSAAERLAIHTWLASRAGITLQ